MKIAVARVAVLSIQAALVMSSVALAVIETLHCWRGALGMGQRKVFQTYVGMTERKQGKRVGMTLRGFVGVSSATNFTALYAQRTESAKTERLKTNAEMKIAKRVLRESHICPMCLYKRVRAYSGHCGAMLKRGRTPQCADSGKTAVKQNYENTENEVFSSVFLTGKLCMTLVTKEWKALCGNAGDIARKAENRHIADLAF